MFTPEPDDGVGGLEWLVVGKHCRTSSFDPIKTASTRLGPLTLYTQVAGPEITRQVMAVMVVYFGCILTNIDHCK
jgi:hypothetical protein